MQRAKSTRIFATAALTVADRSSGVEFEFDFVVAPGDEFEVDRVRDAISTGSHTHPVVRQDQPSAAVSALFASSRAFMEASRSFTIWMRAAPLG